MLSALGDHFKNVFFHFLKMKSVVVTFELQKFKVLARLYNLLMLRNIKIAPSYNDILIKECRFATDTDSYFA